ncbi:MAG: hypothetical protein MJZ41_09305 [Bacteroidaceae bacterium]|nr:hypothetical protein [Bacteroidaceae bacterium]
MKKHYLAPAAIVENSVPTTICEGSTFPDKDFTATDIDQETFDDVFAEPTQPSNSKAFGDLWN